MDQVEIDTPKNSAWYTHKNLVIAWLLIFWPVGLFHKSGD